MKRINYLKQVNDRSGIVNDEMWKMANGDLEEYTETGDGEFDNFEWLAEERMALVDARDVLYEVQTIEGGVSYE